MRNRKLVFYSGGQNPENKYLHEYLAQLTGKSSPNMTYLAFCWDGAEKFYLKAKKRYKPHGIRVNHMLNVDIPNYQKGLKKAFDSDIIYMAGGNTFYFLKFLQQSGMIPRLRKYVNQGGVLAGLSAGGIIMTPHIYMAAYPKYLGDVNEVKLKNLKSLDLVDFEFCPHYVNSAPLNKALISYSRRADFPILASADGGGIGMDGDHCTFFGKNYAFQKGKKLSLSF